MVVHALYFLLQKMLRQLAAVAIKLRILYSASVHLCCCVSLVLFVLASRILSYHGQLELGDNARPAAVRTCVQAGCSQNLHEFLKELGFV